MMKALSGVVSLLCLTTISIGQTFTEQSLDISSSYDTFNNTARLTVGDYNGDGLPDILMSETYGRTRLFKNNGSYDFENVWETEGRDFAAVSFTDINNDNLLDILVGGSEDVGGRAIETLLFLQNADGTFQESNIELPYVFGSLPRWGDIDMDGDYDVIINSSSSVDIEGHRPFIKVLINENGAAFSELLDISSSADFSNTPGTFADTDKDGDLDFWSRGSLYINENREFSGTDWDFSPNTPWTFDMENDGDLDIIGTASGTFEISRNMGDRFEFRCIVTDDATFKIRLGDVNNDGLVDILRIGNGNTKIYINQGDFEYEELSTTFPNTQDASFVDIDGDLDLDLLLVGVLGVFEPLLYLNNSSVANTRPSVPDDLLTTVSDTVRLSWSSSIDAETNNASLSYNVALYSSEDTIVSPLSNASGLRMVNRLGNAQLNNFYLIQGLPIGEYFWKVQAIDNGWQGSAFSEEATFTIPPISSFTLIEESCETDTIYVEYSGNASDNAEYRWYLDGAVEVSGSGQGPLGFYWDQEGDYSVSLVVEENGVTSDSIYQNISVNYRPTFELTYPDLTCFGDSIKIAYGGDAQEGAQFTWSYNDTTIIHQRDSLTSLSDTLTLFIESEGEVSFSLEIEDNGCSSDTTFVVNMNELLSSVFDFDEIVCQPDTSQLTLIDSLPQGTNYHWSLDEGEIIGDNDSTDLFILWDSLGSKSISLVVEEEGCVSDTTIQTLSVNYTPSISLSYADSLCFGETLNITFTGEADSSAMFSWFYEQDTLSLTRDSLLALSDTVDLQLASSGSVNVGLNIEDSGCSSDTTFNITVNELLSSSFETSSIICEGDTSLVQFIGSAPQAAIFHWNVGGGTLVEQENGNDISIAWNNFGEDEISLMLTDDGCQSDVTSFVVEYRQQPSVTFTAPTSTCIDEEISISANTNTFATDYNWNFGDAEVLSGSAGGPYQLRWSAGGTKEITLSVNNGICMSETTVHSIDIPELPITPEICLVTVDSISNRNKILWTDNSDLDSIYIYRETNVSDEYDLIGIASAQTGSFVDENSFPTDIANRYRIAKVDTCGFMSGPSSIHKTMHLTINQGVGASWNLIWDGYEGISFGSYGIFRGSSEESLTLLREVPGNLTSFTDSEAPSGLVYYQVRLILEVPCKENSESDPSGSSRSNVANNSVEVLSIAEKSMFSIYPNPAYGQLSISGAGIFENYEIIDLAGKVIKQGPIPRDGVVQLSDIIPGVYLIKVRNERIISVQKFIKN